MIRSRLVHQHAVPAVLLFGLAMAPFRAEALQEREPAPQDTTALEELVVTVHRSPVPLRATSASVTILDGRALEEAGYVSVLDALRSVPGLTIVQAGSFGAITSAFMRGGESDYVGVLIDGVQVNEPGGRFDFAHLPLQQIERIEVVRGPASSMYGSDAMSGVIQIFTRTGAGAPRMTADARGGTYDSWRGSVGVEGGADRVRYGLAATAFGSDGTLPLNNHYRNVAFSGRVDLQPDDRTDLQLSAHYVDHSFHFPTDGGGAVVDENAFAFGDDLTLGLNVRHRPSTRTELVFQLSARDSEGGTDDLTDGPADSTGFFAFQSLDDVRRLAAEARVGVDLGVAGHSTLGAEIEDQQLRSLSESRSEFGQSSGSSEESRSNRAYSGAWRGDWDALSANASLRVEDNEAFGQLVTYSVGSAYFVSGSRTKLRASVGRGIKEPTLFENFATGFARGNPDLEPESSTGWEVGLDQFLLADRLRLSASYFDQSFDDLIQFTFAPPTPDDPNFFNVASAATRGIETEAELALGPLEFSASYTYLDTEVTDSGFDEGDDANFVEGDRLLRRPRHQAGVEARFRASARGSVGAGVRHTGDRVDRDFAQVPAPRVLLPAYTTLDAFGEWRLRSGAASGPGLAITARIENLLDEAYSEIQGFPARGRTIWLGGRAVLGGER